MHCKRRERRPNPNPSPNPNPNPNPNPKQAAKRPRVAKPKRVTETVPEFDRKTGQLVMVERLVEMDEEEEAADQP